MVLSTCIFVGGCGYPISIIVVHSGTSLCAFINDYPIYASTLDAVIFVIILHTLLMGPFSRGIQCSHSGHGIPPLCYMPWSPTSMIHHYVSGGARGLG